MELNIRFRLAGYGDAPQIAALMAEAEQESTDGIYVAGGDRSFVEEHIERQGFCVIAEVTQGEKQTGTLQKLSPGEFAGFVMVRFPELSEDNLGRVIGMADEELLRVTHVEEAVVVKKFRGNHIERLLFGEMDRYIDRNKYQHVLMVISPNNPASLKSAMASGFTEAARTKSYHGVERILLARN